MHTGPPSATGLFRTESTILHIHSCGMWPTSQTHISFMPLKQSPDGATSYTLSLTFQTDNKGVCSHRDYHRLPTCLSLVLCILFSFVPNLLQLFSVWWFQKERWEFHKLLQVSVQNWNWNCISWGWSRRLRRGMSPVQIYVSIRPNRNLNYTVPQKTVLLWHNVTSLQH